MPAGSHVDIEISGSAHGHSRGHRAFLTVRAQDMILNMEELTLRKYRKFPFQVRYGYRNEAHGVNRLFRSGLIAGGNGGFDSTAAVVSTVVSALVSAAEADGVSAVPDSSTCCGQGADRRERKCKLFQFMHAKFFSPFKLSVQCLLSAFWLLPCR